MQVSVALTAQQYVSVSAEKSFLQQEYVTAYEAMCEKYGVAQPFELDDDRLREFFSELSSSWKTRKRELYQAGQITAEQL
ncbi:hypothetical protein MPK67_gp078 [Erwinia phage pEa_SNUABM_32]|uniref:Uncharacterized protein n=2 Tax=Alexandravirus TaxID=2733088 RepID=A0AAE8BYQ3_9CAUD|nr:hypothetical protein MPK67_gp078 [Erwinia phage pEa_SNUABM_32]YP_010301191.1 hypothetical protein MPK68_gp078 [Erwinia phage pEa_SNUABM_3]QZE56614.1 hypothetical protein pEaSNUABM20_00078 [Erwinia phage pEa_SNUABM_20]QZE58294.1 hypothetical protein pEaSNUABM40_00078 [Erwinia phage pEa_SNUABM_40]UAW52859.1 hypothetical protein pEaSNUABM23_00077 [Erwinia phage pEa_SNUABM_23]UIW10755.1 hypothetical protein pEaSNUABM23_00077 [Erwinia phage pEa_SNUABM_31]QZE56275.1 hypothetical protein pEaSNUAB